MGCHTWFSRPITPEERALLRSTAKQSIEEVLSDEPVYDALKKKLLESVEKDTNFWIANGYFTSRDFTEEYDGKIYVNVTGHFVEEDYVLKHNKPYHDNFRVKHYPNWVIHNMYELRKKMKKKYFELTKEQYEQVSNFFKDYPGGIITFG